MSSPQLEDGKFDSCNRFAIDYWDGWNRPENASHLETVPCTEWEYDDSLFAVRIPMQGCAQVWGVA